VTLYIGQRKTEAIGKWKPFIGIDVPQALSVKELAGDSRGSFRFSTYVYGIIIQDSQHKGVAPRSLDPSLPRSLTIALSFEDEYLSSGNCIVKI
jgi:hypothetical protein